MKCPECLTENSEDSNYCKKCGHVLAEPVCVDPADDTIPCERKQVTVLFSDLSGYTAMTERLDPEEVKAIMSDIFADITGIITRYEGHVERFIGDAVMAVFGMPIAHELDPVRALRATLEIHERLEKLNPRYEDTFGQPLSMHSGLNTGLVVTGEVDLEKGTHGITGDSVNTAARIQGLANSGEILVGQETFRRTEGYFNFEAQPPCAVKNKSAPLCTYKVLSRKNIPEKVHRISGRRAQLIGREAEMGVLAEAVKRLEDGRGSVVAICGDAGTGKSRLISEFKTTLDRKAIQWREGHAYGYTQNIPYYPLINLLSHAFRIEEGDPPSTIRDKVEKGVAYVMGSDRQIVPYIGSLFSIDYPEISQVSPEFWKSRLHAAIQSIVGRMSQTGPTVICIEDLHWADASFVELLHELVVATVDRVLFICVYRPRFELFEDQIPDAIAGLYHTIRLEALSADNTRRMLKSLLQTDRIPGELDDFVDQKSEGNPFYLEELVNSLIDTQSLIAEDGAWKTNRDLANSDIPTSIHGVLASRIDRLDNHSKLILQEASVIGRAFLFKLLQQITDLKIPIDPLLDDLQQRDLIQIYSLDRDLEYIFKHALIQEVAYNGLLRVDCHRIHERIAVVIEGLFHDRLHEFYETLAYHFKNASRHRKAIFYLNHSGEKSLSRFAVAEAHQFYEDAFNLLIQQNSEESGNADLLLDTLLGWALVYYYRGHFKQAENLFARHIDIVEKTKDKKKLGLYYAWLGFIYSNREKLEDSYNYLIKALTLGEQTGDQQVIGYACTWLTWACADLGRFDEAISYGEKAQKIAKSLSSDAYLYFKSLSGMGYTNYFKGYPQKTIDAGEKLIVRGEETGNIRCEALGHYIKAYGYTASGNFLKVIESSRTAIKIAKDPFYSHLPRFILGLSYLLNEQLEQSNKEIKKFIEYSKRGGCEIAGTPARALHAVLSITDGNMTNGMNELKHIQNQCLHIGRINVYIAIEHMLGRIYLKMYSGPTPSLSILIKNLGFIIRHVPFARKRSEMHFNNTIRMAREIGAMGTLGQAYLDLGALYLHSKNKSKAKEVLENAICLFKECQADGFLKQAEVLMKSA